MFSLSPAVAGFIKNILMLLILTLVAYLGNAAHLSGILSPTIAVVVASLFSGLESSLKAKDNGDSALFGAVQLKK